MLKFFQNPKVRLAARAILAGVAVAYTQLAGAHYAHAAIEAACVAGVWAAVEYVTPLNGVVGLFKTAVQFVPALKPFAPPTTPTPAAAATSAHV